MIVILPPAGRGTAPTFSSKASLGSKLSRPTLAQLGPDGGCSMISREEGNQVFKAPNRGLSSNSP